MVGRAGEVPRGDEAKVEVNFMGDLCQGESRAGLSFWENLPSFYAQQIIFYGPGFMVVF